MIKLLEKTSTILSLNDPLGHFIVHGFLFKSTGIAGAAVLGWIWLVVLCLTALFIPSAEHFGGYKMMNLAC